MNFLTILLLAVGLAMDAFAVSIASGISIKSMHIYQPFVIASFFGIFQALMPVLGWCLGIRIADTVAGFDHWIIFAVLSFIGLKMIYEATFLKESEKVSASLGIYTLFILAVATSIDAFAVGITLSLLHSNIWFVVVTIGLVTFILSLGGVYLGKSFGHLFENKIEIAGGILLIALGTKILVENLYGWQIF
ncbi:manganese efflux pump MntP family protein [Chitinispirillales bacterium ANBcel5]|uniref:manganese efflux pump MntP n=1 Tax=Cellulosispirillum alkaliphilum TaxID=3039283 RepID=UPI002A57C044|nr:manganese efflux pump MntP family protein [Chitinispirillales bacterium ANBcel5]